MCTSQTPFLVRTYVIQSGRAVWYTYRVLLFWFPGEGDFEETVVDVSGNCSAHPVCSCLSYTILRAWSVVLGTYVHRDKYSEVPLLIGNF